MNKTKEDILIWANRRLQHSTEYNADKAGIFIPILDNLLNGEGSIDEIKSFEEKLFGSYRVTPIIARFLFLNDNRSEVTPFRYMNQLTEDEIISRFFLAFNGKSYTLQQVADVIGFTGNRGSIHSKFDNVFADVKEFTNEEKAISISFALQYNLQGMKLHGRSLKQSRKIYLSAIEDLQYLNHVVKKKKKQCVDKKVFDLCDIIKEDREEIKQLKSILAVVNKSEPVTDKKKRNLITSLRI